MEAGGTDSDGRVFKNASEMWMQELGEGGDDASKKTQWYSQGVGYWQVCLRPRNPRPSPFLSKVLISPLLLILMRPQANFYGFLLVLLGLGRREEKGVEASVDGVLGGYGYVNEADIKCSEPFLKALLAERFPGADGQRHLVALDCGSGIGRITKNLLIRYFNEVDLLEPVSHFLEAARRSLAPENYTAAEFHRASNFYCLPLQEFTPEIGRYDVIWIQWCIGHLADDDFISFFKRAKVGLKPGGFFVVKENIARNGFVLDKEDRSITRSDLYFKELFRQCGLHLFQLKDQRGFPDELFAVKMYALTPDAPKRVQRTRSKAKANRPGIIR